MKAENTQPEQPILRACSQGGRYSQALTHNYYMLWETNLTSTKRKMKTTETDATLSLIKEIH
jgi:hypothetical protein